MDMKGKKNGLRGVLRETLIMGIIWTLVFILLAVEVCLCLLLIVPLPLGFKNAFVKIFAETTGALKKYAPAGFGHCESSSGTPTGILCHCLSSSSLSSQVSARVAMFVLRTCPLFDLPSSAESARKVFTGRDTVSDESGEVSGSGGAVNYEIELNASRELMTVP